MNMFKTKITYSRFNVVLASLSIPILTALMWFNETPDILRVNILLLLVYIISSKLTKKTSDDIGIKLNVFITILILKIVISFFVAYVGWIPMLDQQALNYGYDPQRYYFQANDLINNNFNIREVTSINYTGIIYYYAFLFFLFGHNPIVPLLANSLTTLITCLYIVRLIKFAMPNYTNLKLIGLFMLIPEILWYDILSSRESIIMLLVVASIYKLISMFYSDSKITKKRVLSFSIALLIIGIIRTSMIIPIVVIFALYWIFVRYSGSKKRVGILISLVILIFLLVVPQITSSLGSYKFSIEYIQKTLSAERVLGDANLDWSSNSIGKLLIADNIFETIIFTPLKMFIYLISPLPNFMVNIQGLLKSDWGAWQKLMTVASSFVYFYFLIYIFAGVINYLKTKDKRCLIAFIIPFFTMLITIAAGTQIIHERYRIVALPFVFVLAIYGKNSSKYSKQMGFFLWQGMIMVGIILYAAMKLT